MLYVERALQGDDNLQNIIIINVNIASDIKETEMII